MIMPSDLVFDLRRAANNQALSVGEARNLLEMAATELAREREKVRELVKTLRECADDLEIEVNNTYAGMLNYPHMQRKHERDMAPVLRARAALIKATGGEK